MLTFPQLLINGSLGAILLLALTGINTALAQQDQQDDMQSNSIANNWNKRMFMLNSDVFRNRRGWANNKDMEISNNVEINGGQQQLRSARRSPTPTQGTRSRSCYFTPIQCSLYQQKFNNLESEGVHDLSVIRPIRPLMNSPSNANSRKRQTAKHNAMLIQRWRNAADTSRLRV